MNIVKWYKNRSFQFKLVIGYLVLALIPMLCVTWYSYGKTRNVLLTEAYQSAEQEAERIEKNFSTMVEPYETILDVLYVDQMLSGYLFQDYSNDSYEDMFYYIDKKLSEICLMNAGIYKICFYSNNETLPQDNYYFYSMQDLDRRECVLTFDAIGETVFCGTSGDGKAFHMNRLMNFYPQGGMKSVLSLQIENQQIQPLLETINSTDEIYLVDQKGYILAASEPVIGSSNMTPRSSSTISLVSFPESSLIYGRSTTAFSERDTVNASLAVSTLVTTFSCLIVRFWNIAAFSLKFPSSSRFSNEQIRE